MVRRGKFSRSLVVTASVVLIALLAFKAFAQEKVKLSRGYRPFAEFILSEAEGLRVTQGRQGIQ